MVLDFIGRFSLSQDDGSVPGKASRQLASLAAQSDRFSKHRLRASRTVSPKSASMKWPHFFLFSLWSFSFFLRF
jgi:hypothetical protein